MRSCRYRTAILFLAAAAWTAVCAQSPEAVPAESTAGADVKLMIDIDFFDHLSEPHVYGVSYFGPDQSAALLDRCSDAVRLTALESSDTGKRVGHGDKVVASPSERTTYLREIRAAGIKTRKAAVDYALSCAKRVERLRGLFANPLPDDEYEDALDSTYNVMAVREHDKPEYGPHVDEHARKTVANRKSDNRFR